MAYQLNNTIFHISNDWHVFQNNGWWLSCYSLWIFTIDINGRSHFVFLLFAFFSVRFNFSGFLQKIRNNKSNKCKCKKERKKYEREKILNYEPRNFLWKVQKKHYDHLFEILWFNKSKNDRHIYAVRHVYEISVWYHITGFRILYNFFFRSKF